MVIGEYLGMAMVEYFALIMIKGLFENDEYLGMVIGEYLGMVMVEYLVRITVEYLVRIMGEYLGMIIGLCLEIVMSEYTWEWSWVCSSECSFANSGEPHSRVFRNDHGEILGMVIGEV